MFTSNNETLAGLDYCVQLLFNDVTVFVPADWSTRPCNRNRVQLDNKLITTWLIKSLYALSQRYTNTPHPTASFPGLPTAQFWSLAVCKNGGRPGPFYVNDISVLVNRGEEGSPIKWTNLRTYLVVSSPSAEVWTLTKLKAYRSWF